MATCIIRSRGLAAALLAAVLAAAVPSAPAATAPAGGAVTTIDDQVLRDRILQTLTKMNDAHELKSVKELRRQLDRKRYPLRLPKPPDRKLDAAELYEQAQSRVLIFCHLYHCTHCSHWHVSTSTCYALTADGIVVANYHAFGMEEAAGVAVATAEGRVFPVTEVLAADAGDDVAVMRVAATDLQPLALSVDEPVGRPVSVVSHPSGLFFVMTQGHVSRYYLAAEEGGKFARMAITADYAKGSSGGPVFNACGAVVGMVASTRSIYYDDEHGKHDNLQMVIKSCVPARSIRKLLAP